MLIEELTQSLLEGNCKATEINFQEIDRQQAYKLLLALNNRKLPNVTQIHLTINNASSPIIQETNDYCLTLNCINLSSLKINLPLTMRTIDLSKCAKLMDLTIQSITTQHISLPYAAHELKFLDISNSGIKFLCISDYTNLEAIQAKDSAIEELYIKSCNKLKLLDLTHTLKLKNVELNCSHLKTALLRHSALDYINLQYCSFLQVLDCYASGLRYIDNISTCTQLQQINLSYTAIKIISSFEGNYKLSIITLLGLNLSKLGQFMLQTMIPCKLAIPNIKFIHNQRFADNIPSILEFNTMLHEHFSDKLEIIEGLERKSALTYNPQDSTILNRISLRLSDEYDELCIAFVKSVYAEEVKSFKKRVSTRITRIHGAIERCKYWAELTDIMRDSVQITFSEVEVSDLQNQCNFIFSEATNKNICRFLKKINCCSLPLKLIDLRTFDAEHVHNTDSGVNLQLNCPQLEIFRVDTPCISLLDLTYCSSLVDLCLQNLKISLLPDISKCKELRTLNIIGTHLSDLGVFALHQLQKLHENVELITSDYLKQALRKVSIDEQNSNTYTDLLLEAINTFQNCHIYMIRRIDQIYILECQKIYTAQGALLQKIFTGENHQKYFAKMMSNLDAAIAKRLNLEQTVSANNRGKRTAKVYM